MEKQRKNWMNRYSTLTALLIVLAVNILLITKPFDNSEKYISISKMIQKSEQCPTATSSFSGSSVAVDYKQLSKNSELYTRHLVKITGYVNQILDMNGKGTILLQIPKQNIFSPDYVISVYYVGQADVVEKDMITIYGFIS